jgi:hypothetical protein
MVTGSRTRTRDIREGDTSYFGDGWNGASHFYQSAAVGSQTTSDYVGNPLGMNPLDITTIRNSPCVINGTNGKTGISKREFNSLPCTYFNTIEGHLPQSTPFRDATEALASVNPGNSAVSLPNFLFELKDVPGMLRHAASRARLLHMAYLKHAGRSPTHRRIKAFAYGKGELGEDYLNYVFGWQPFFSDLSSILDTSQFLENRAKKYSKVRNGLLKTTGSLGQSTESYIYDRVLQSLAITVSGQITANTTRERWFSARWRVNPIRFGEALSGNTRSRLRDSLGLDYALPLELWEAMPWSWFSDWFFNAGAIINLLGNRQGIQFQSACIMTHTATKRTIQPIWQTKTYSVSLGWSSKESKTRTLFSPSFIRSDFADNVFEAPHLAVLASLAVTRGKGSSRF